MPVKEVPCALCWGSGEFKGAYITDCTECQGTGFIWVMNGDDEYDTTGKYTKE